MPFCLPIGSVVVPFRGFYLESYRVIPEGTAIKPMEKKLITEGNRNLLILIAIGTGTSSLMLDIVAVRVSGTQVWQFFVCSRNQTEMLVI